MTHLLRTVSPTGTKHSNIWAPTGAGLIQTTSDALSSRAQLQKVANAFSFPSVKGIHYFLRVWHIWGHDNDAFALLPFATRLLRQKTPGNRSRKRLVSGINQSLSPRKRFLTVSITCQRTLQERLESRQWWISDGLGPHVDQDCPGLTPKPHVRVGRGVGRI